MGAQRAYRGHWFEDDRSNSYRVLRVWVKMSEEKTQRTRLIRRSTCPIWR